MIAGVLLECQCAVSCVACEANTWDTVEHVGYFPVNTIIDVCPRLLYVRWGVIGVPVCCSRGACEASTWATVEHVGYFLGIEHVGYFLVNTIIGVYP